MAKKKKKSRKPKHVMMPVVIQLTDAQLRKYLPKLKSIANTREKWPAYKRPR